MTFRTLFTGLLFLATFNSFGQQPPKAYLEAIALAEQHFEAREFQKAAQAYSKAFHANKNLGFVIHRYSAARSWAAVNEIDSAFYQLHKIAASGHYADYQEITSEPQFEILRNDKRWNPLIRMVRSNKEKAEAALNKPLVAILDTVHFEDQKYRKQIAQVESKYGRSSEESKQLWDAIERTDSINLVKVRGILDRYGWLGPEEVGEQGNSALFLVIQHANIETQEKYLPMMREAARNGKAQASQLALLEDRIAIRRGRKQIYGSQIGRNLQDGSHYVLPLEDPANVDKRRAEVQLPALKDYVSHWGILWSLDQYEKDLKKNQ